MAKMRTLALWDSGWEEALAGPRRNSCGRRGPAGGAFWVATIARGKDQAYFRPHSAQDSPAHYSPVLQLEVSYGSLTVDVSESLFVHS
jgi:hypothetical protein